jgi:outer membrane protein TolC
VKNIAKVLGFNLVFTLGSFLGYGQTAGPSLSLKDCIELAKQESPTLKSALLQEEIAEKKVSEVRGSGLPQISLSGNYQDNIKKSVTVLEGGGMFGGKPGEIVKLELSPKHVMGVTGQVNQLLFDGSFWVGLSAAKRSGEYYGQAVKSAEEDVVYNVADAYYKVITADKQIDLLQYNITSLEKTMQNTELLYKNGRVKKVDLDRIKVNYNILTTQLNTARNGLKIAYDNLKYQMGVPFETKISLQEDKTISVDSVINLNIDESIFQDTTGQFYRNRIEYKQLLTARELQVLNQKNQMAAYFPRLSAFGSYAYQSQSEKFNFFDKNSYWFEVASVGLNLSWSIFTGGSNLARVQQAALNVKVADENIKDTELAMNLQLSSARTKFKSAYDNIENERKNVELARDVYKVTELEFREGTSASANLVDAESSLREAQTNFINSLLELYTTRLEYERAKGSLMDYINSITTANNN